MVNHVESDVVPDTEFSDEDLNFGYTQQDQSFGHCHQPAIDDEADVSSSTKVRPDDTAGDVIARVS